MVKGSPNDKSSPSGKGSPNGNLVNKQRRVLNTSPIVLLIRSWPRASATSCLNNDNRMTADLWTQHYGWLATGIYQQDKTILQDVLYFIISAGYKKMFFPSKLKGKNNTSKIIIWNTSVDT